MTIRYCVAVYMIDKAYGGAEEGGWWYTYGDLVKLLKVFGNEKQAYDYANRLNDRLETTLNKGRRSISSVLSEGRYSAKVYENSPPQHFPEVTPHYE